MNVAYAGITMDPPGSGLGGPRGGRGHLISVRGDSAATVVPRCEVEVAVNAALPSASVLASDGDRCAQGRASDGDRSA